MNLEKKIKSIISKRTTLHLSQLRLDSLHKRLRKRYIDERRLKKILEKEYKDVVALERKSIGWIFKNVLGDKEQQMEIERQEYLQAVLNHKECLKEIKILEFEIDILTEKVNAMGDVEKEYAILLLTRERQILTGTGKHRAAIKQFDQQADDAFQLKREIFQAKIVGTKIKTRLEKMIIELGKAAELGIWNLKAYNDMKIKTGPVSNAQKLYYEIKPLLLDFKTELEDIYKHRKIKLTAGLENLDDLSNVYYGNLISDWVVQRTIRNALANMESLQDRIIRVLQSLEVEIQRADQTIAYSKERKKALILDGLK